jgi:hypothetical protein
MESTFGTILNPTTMTKGRLTRDDLLRMMFKLGDSVPRKSGDASEASGSFLK